MNVLGIDYGTEHIGIALGSTESGLAEPLTTLLAHQNPDSAIRALVSEHHSDIVVVGVSEKTSAAQAEQFANCLKLTVNLPVHLVDETLSSKEAISKLLHKSRKKRAIEQHAASAAVILERWMEEQS